MSRGPGGAMYNPQTFTQKMVLSDKLEHPQKAPQVNHHAAQKLGHSVRAALRFCL
jgi:hypothetical protein